MLTTFCITAALFRMILTGSPLAPWGYDHLIDFNNVKEINQFDAVNYTADSYNTGKWAAEVSHQANTEEETKYSDIGAKPKYQDATCTSIFEAQYPAGPHTLYQTNTSYEPARNNTQGVLTRAGLLGQTNGALEYTTYYMRGDVWTQNTMEDFQLDETQSTSEQYTRVSYSGDRRVHWGLRVWTINTTGDFVEMTNGTPVAQVSRREFDIGEGYQTSIWPCPTIDLSNNKCLRIRVYIKVGGTWLQGGNPADFIQSNSTGFIKAYESVWKVCYYTKRVESEGDTVAYFYWGTPSKNCWIKEIALKPHHGNYGVYRAGYTFDTRSLGEQAKIVEAKLGFNVAEVDNDTAYDVCVQADTSSAHPHWGAYIEEGDYCDSYYGTTIYGSISASNVTLGWNNITLTKNALIDIIKTNRLTRIMLRTSGDISNQAPIGDEYVCMHLASAVKLYVTWVHPVKFYRLSWTSVEAGGSCNFSVFCECDDKVYLDKWIFSTNNTGTWINATFSFPENVSSSWANKTGVTLNSKENTIIGFRFYARVKGGHWCSTKLELFQARSLPTFIRFAEFYDDRRLAVTISIDDWGGGAWHKEQTWKDKLEQNQMYYSVGIITNNMNATQWNSTQRSLNDGWMEVTSHSVTHDNIEWQFNQSRNDMIGNLTLPAYWEMNGTEYVLAWIAPHHINGADRLQWAYDSNYLFYRALGEKGWGVWTEQNIYLTSHTLQSDHPNYQAEFDWHYGHGFLYHVMAHPNIDNENTAFAHFDYICNKTDVSYIPYGLAYIYHYCIRQVVDIEYLGSRIWKLNVPHNEHIKYGLKYPITLIFEIPHAQQEATAYYRYKTTEPWTELQKKEPTDFFNGIDCVRCDFNKNVIYISVSFSNVSDYIYIKVPAPPEQPDKVGVGKGRNLLV